LRGLLFLGGVLTGAVMLLAALTSKKDSNRLLKKAHLRRYAHPSSLRRTARTPHSSGFRKPCIWTFLISLSVMRFYCTLANGGGEAGRREGSRCKAASPEE